MSSCRRDVGRGAVAMAALALLFSLAGCGGSGPKTYPVKGNVVLKDGDVSRLAGHLVEFQLESDHAVRASGPIGPDGGFALGSYYQGQQLDGVVGGTHQARIILLTEDEEEEDSGRAKGPPGPVHHRYLEFDTSGLSFTVPSDADIAVAVSRR